MMMSKILSTLMTIVTNTTVEHRGQHRDRDAPQRLPLGGPVDVGRLEGLAVESRQPGRHDDHGEARPDPQVGEDHRDVDQRDAEQRLCRLAETAGGRQRLAAQPEADAGAEARVEVGRLDPDVERPGAHVGEAELPGRRRWSWSQPCCRRC